MTVESLSFKTQEEKDQAIDDYDVSSGNEDGLTQIMNAEIKVEAAKTPAIPEENAPIEPVDENLSVPPVEELPKEVVPNVESTEPLTYKKEDLPPGYKNFGEVLKKLKNQDELIERQGTKIQQDQEKLSVFQEKPPVVEKEIVEEIKPIDYSKITELRNKLAEAIPYGEDATNLQLEINNEMFKNQQEGNQSVSSRMDKLEQSHKDYLENQTANEQKSIRDKAAEDQYKEMDDFIGSDENKEMFGMTRPFKEVESEHGVWGNNVAFQFYKRPAKDYSEITHSLTMLERGSPTLIKDCELANIPTEAPNADVEKYVKAMEVYNYKEGWRTNPNGTMSQVTRYDPIIGKEVPDKFPSINAAYENMKVNSGYYKNKELTAFDKGVKAHSEVANTRDTNILSNDHQSNTESQVRTLDIVEKELLSLPNNSDPDNLAKAEELQKEAEALEEAQLLSKTR